MASGFVGGRARVGWRCSGYLPAISTVCGGGSDFSQRASDHGNYFSPTR